jgi:uncharacterized protein (TIGR02594 family)
MQAHVKSSSVVLGSVCAALMVALPLAATPATARPARHHLHQAHQRVAYRSVRGRHHWAASGQRYRSARAGAADVTRDSDSATSGATDSDVVAEARRWLGGNPTSRRSLWCATFMNFVLQRTGHRGTGSDMAKSFASYGHPVSGPRVGAIAVMSRRGGGHVGVVSGLDSSGNPIIISGNSGNRVRESVYRAGRIYAYVMP